MMIIILIEKIVMIVQRELPVINRGRKFLLARTQVEDKLKMLAPQRVMKYGVEVGGQEYPVRQVLAVATGTPEIEWSTVNAYRILQRLGFEIRIH